MERIKADDECTDAEAPNTGPSRNSHSTSTHSFAEQHAKPGNSEPATRWLQSAQRSNRLGTNSRRVLQRSNRMPLLGQILEPAIEE